MAFVKAVKKTVYNTRQVRRSVGDTTRNDVFVMCDLQADALPSGDELPTIGAMIEGLDDDAIVDAGSRIEVLEPNGIYTMGQDLSWYKTGG